MDVNINDLFEKEVMNFCSKLSSEPNSKNIASILLFKHYVNQLWIFFHKLGRSDFKPYMVIPSVRDNPLDWISPGILNNCLEMQFFTRTLLKDIPVGRSPRLIDYIFIYFGLYTKIFVENGFFDENKDIYFLYEPVLKIIQRGNYINRESSFVGINNRDMVFEIGFKLPSQEPDFLDFIDNKFEKEQLHYIPNNRQILEIWKAYNKLS